MPRAPDDTAAENLMDALHVGAGRLDPPVRADVAPDLLGASRDGVAQHHRSRDGAWEDVDERVPRGAEIAGCLPGGPRDHRGGAVLGPNAAQVPVIEGSDH